MSAFDASCAVEEAMSKLRSACLHQVQLVRDRDRTIRELQVQMATQQATLDRLHAESLSPASSSPSPHSSAVSNTLAEKWATENCLSPSSELCHLEWLQNWSEAYPAPPIPLDDAERCRAVDELFILDSEPESIYNDLCACARTMLDVDLVCIDIVAKDRIWFKAASTSHPKLSALRGAPRNLAPCNYVVKKGSTLVVPDMQSDLAFQMNPLTAMDCSFYAGAPLTTAAGIVIGVFAVLDTRPYRPFGQREVALLELMASTTIRQLEARKAAMQVDRMKEQFLANISHELRTPLHGIIGVANLLAADTALTHVQREYVADAQSQAHTLLHIVNDLLDCAKLHADKITITPERVDLRETLVAFARRMQLQANVKQIAIDLRVDGVPPAVRALVDAHRLTQILSNLLSNSIKFSPHASRIEVRAWITNQRPVEPIMKDEHGKPISAPTMSPAAEVSAISGAGDQFLSFSVRDSGIGMSSALLPRLFDSFAQEDETSSRAFGGSGLGLSISRRMSALMGGSLWMQESTRGRGTIMTGFISAPADSSADAREEEGNSDADDEERESTTNTKRSTNNTPMRMAMHSDTITTTSLPSASPLDSAPREHQQGQTPDRGLQLHSSMTPLSLDSSVRAIHSDATMSISPQFPSSSSPRSLSSPPPLEAVSSVASTVTGESPSLGPTSPRMGSDLVASLTASPSLSTSSLSSTSTGRMRTRTISDRPPRGKHKLSGPPLLILVVDDLPLNIKIATRLLESMGHRVQAATGGRAAVEMVKAQHFDCILMDVQMPDLNGLESTRQIRALETDLPFKMQRVSVMDIDMEATGGGGDVAASSAAAASSLISPSSASRLLSRGVSSSDRARITILAFTASAMPEDQTACLRAGMDGVVTKPLDPELLTTRLKQIQDGIIADGGR